ncbi:MAG: hypothetical protein AAGG11_07725 [Pseudomonadota bacterium]
MASEPGLGVVAVGADSWAVEVLAGEKTTEVFPVHQELLTKNGVYILENMDDRPLVADAATEDLFVLGQPRVVESVPAVISSMAIR